jgi:hypothetical protein
MNFEPGLTPVTVRSVGKSLGINPFQASAQQEHIRAFVEFKRTQPDGSGSTPASKLLISSHNFVNPDVLKTSKWCPGKDSNLHGLHRWYLKPVRLPIPPPGHGRFHTGGYGGLSMSGPATGAGPELRAECRLGRRLRIPTGLNPVYC